MVANFEELSLDQQITSKIEGQNAYPSPQFETAWYENFTQLFNPAYTTVELNSAISSVNTTFKAPGRMVFDVTTGRPVWATGETINSTWVDSTGAVVNTPV